MGTTKLCYCSVLFSLCCLLQLQPIVLPKSGNYPHIVSEIDAILNCLFFSPCLVMTTPLSHTPSVSVDASPLLLRTLVNLPYMTSCHLITALQAPSVFKHSSILMYLEL